MGSVTVSADTIITVAAVIGALGAIFGVIFVIYRWYLKQEKQDKDIAHIKEEDTLIVLHCLPAWTVCSSSAPTTPCRLQRTSSTSTSTSKPTNNFVKQPEGESPTG